MVKHKDDILRSICCKSIWLNQLELQRAGIQQSSWGATYRLGPSPGAVGSSASIQMHQRDDAQGKDLLTAPASCRFPKRTTLQLRQELPFIVNAAVGRVKWALCQSLTRLARLMRDKGRGQDIPPFSRLFTLRRLCDPMGGCSLRHQYVPVTPSFSMKLSATPCNGNLTTLVLLVIASRGLLGRAGVGLIGYLIDESAHLRPQGLTKVKEKGHKASPSSRRLVTRLSLRRSLPSLFFILVQPMIFQAWSARGTWC